MPVNFSSIFDIQIDMTFAIFWGNCKTTLSRKLTEVSQNASAFISIGPPIMKLRPLKKMKKLRIFGGSFLKIKIAGILIYLRIKYFGKGLSDLKN